MAGGSVTFHSRGGRKDLSHFGGGHGVMQCGVSSAVFHAR